MGRNATRGASGAAKSMPAEDERKIHNVVVVDNRQKKSKGEADDLGFTVNEELQVCGLHLRVQYLSPFDDPETDPRGFVLRASAWVVLGGDESDAQMYIEECCRWKDVDLERVLPFVWGQEVSAEDETRTGQIKERAPGTLGEGLYGGRDNIPEAIKILVPDNWDKDEILRVVAEEIPLWEQRNEKVGVLPRKNKPQSCAVM